jgi:MFS transporter
MMVVSAVASLNVALPDIARATDASQSQLQWIIDAYALVFAGLLLPAGAFGDRYGRKGILLSGLVVLGGAAAAAIFVSSPSMLIGLRAVMGIGAAMVMPTTLSIITNVFPEDERGRAVGIWAGIAGGGAVLGLLVSGLLLEWFSWPVVFLTSVVLAALAAALTIPIVPTSRRHRRNDAPLSRSAPRRSCHSDRRQPRTAARCAPRARLRRGVARAPPRRTSSRGPVRPHRVYACRAPPRQSGEGESFRPRRNPARSWSTLRPRRRGDHEPARVQSLAARPCDRFPRDDRRPIGVATTGRPPSRVPLGRRRPRCPCRHITIGHQRAARRSEANLGVKRGFESRCGQKLGKSSGPANRH